MLSSNHIFLVRLSKKASVAVRRATKSSWSFYKPGHHWVRRLGVDLRERV